MEWIGFARLVLYFLDKVISYPPPSNPTTVGESIMSHGPQQHGSVYGRFLDAGVRHIGKQKITFLRVGLNTLAALMFQCKSR